MPKQKTKKELIESSQLNYEKLLALLDSYFKEEI